MSSAPPHHQQHLSSTDMTMLDRVLKDVCGRNSIARGSTDAQRIAALLITEFQRGVNKEADLAMAFVGDGNLRLRVPVDRLSRLMGNRLFGWEDDLGAGAIGSSNKERIA
jgi:hypothetical protein